MRAIFIVCFLFVFVAVEGNTQLFAPRHRHGSVYRKAVEAEQRHHQRIGFIPNTTKNWFTQLIDHSDPSVGTFSDKFYYDTTYWNGQGPCMMYLNGEGPLSSAVGGYMAELAKELQACTLTIEHRYYGESLPTPLINKPFLTKYLTVDQAMQDVVALMQYFEQQIVHRNLTWFLVGGSYSGGMTVWMNEKYPGLFKASWAASGVVRATFAFSDYDGHVKQVTSRSCSEALTQIMRIAEKQWSEGNSDKIRAIFGIPSYNTKTDFMWAMADASATSVQYGQNTAMCNLLLPLPDDDWEALKHYQAVIAEQWGADFMANCYYSTACMANTSMASQWGPGGYSWVWECCNEMAWWQIGYPHSIRSQNITTSYFVNQCRQVFWPDTLSDIWSFNDRYKGLEPVTKGYIIATQGSDDPWSTTGLYQSPGPNFPVNTAQCTNCGHCGSMQSPQSSDPPELVQQRVLVLQYLKQWLAR